MTDHRNDARVFSHLIGFNVTKNQRNDECVLGNLIGCNTRQGKVEGGATTCESKLFFPPGHSIVFLTNCLLISFSTKTFCPPKDFLSLSFVYDGPVVDAANEPMPIHRKRNNT